MSGQEAFEPDWTFSSMADFAAAAREALGGQRVQPSQQDSLNAALLSDDTEACKPHFDLSKAC